MSSSLLFQQLAACFVRRIWMVLQMRARQLYSCCFEGCCFQDLFAIVSNIFVQLPSSFFSLRLVSVRVVHPYSSMDTTATWKK